MQSWKHFNIHIYSSEVYPYTTNQTLGCTIFIILFKVAKETSLVFHTLLISSWLFSSHHSHILYITATTFLDNHVSSDENKRNNAACCITHLINWKGICKPVYIITEHRFIWHQFTRMWQEVMWKNIFLGSLPEKMYGQHT